MHIFLLRGLVREKKHWGDIPQIVKKSFPQSSIHVPEIQGVGEFHNLNSPDNFDDMILFMRDQYKEIIESKEPRLVIAMSLGGMIVRRWLDLYPNDFKDVVLINTSFKGITPLFKRLRPKAILSFVSIFFTTSIEQRERKILELVSNNKERRLTRLDPWIEIQKLRPVKRKNFINQIKAALFVKEAKAKPKNARLLILAAKGDRLCHYESSIYLNKAWGGELKVHPSAGHDIPIDDPSWMLDKIKEWY